MPVSKSAIKAMKQTLKANARNKVTKANFRSKIKAVKKAATTDKKDLGSLTSAAFQAIDKAAKSGVIHKNTAARRKSRLVASLTKDTGKAVELVSVKEAPKTKKATTANTKTTKPTASKPKTATKKPTTTKTTKK